MKNNLEQILNCLREANAEGMIVDTIWMDDDQTLFDFIELCIEEAAVAQQQEAEPEAWLIERLDGRHKPYSPARRVTDAKKYNPMTDDYWPPGAREKCRITPLYPPKPAALPTMDDAIAAGNGTLHGAIDYWQERALKAEAAQPQVPEGCPPDIEVREAVADFMRDTQTLPLDHCARRLVIKIKQMLSAAKEEGK